jgi:hypothetical protein
VGGLAIQFVAASLPIVSQMLGNAAVPVELWAVVVVGASGAWGMSGVISQVAWRRDDAGAGR